MYRHGFNGTLHRGKRKSCAFSRQQLRSRVRAVLKRHMESCWDARGWLEGICANTVSFELLPSSGLDHIPTDSGNLEWLSTDLNQAARFYCGLTVLQERWRKLVALAVFCSQTEYGSWMQNMCGNRPRFWKIFTWETVLWSCFLKTVL